MLEETTAVLARSSSVLVTGGTGTFGNAFVADLLARPDVDRICVLSRDELKQAQMAERFGHDPRLRFFLGDVRDRQRLEEAFYGVDVVVHAAALKRVDAVAYDSKEAKKTNVDGTENVVGAAIAQGVGRVVVLSSDKACLGWSADVEMADGYSASIRDVVNLRATAPIRTLGNNGFRAGTVTGWHRNSLGARRMRKMVMRNPQIIGSHRGVRGLMLTDDHPVLTPLGWRAAGTLGSGDLVITAEPAPNDAQRALLVGMLLGDASIARIKPSSGYPNTYVHTGHAENQLEWLHVKYAALDELAVGPPRLERTGARGGERRQPFWLLRLRSMRYVLDLYDSFYPEGNKRKKLVPRELVQRHMGPVLLAAWYMDDGTFLRERGNARPSARLETQGFCEEDVRWIATMLTNAGFPSYAYRHVVAKKAYWQLRFTVEGAAALFRYVGRFIPPALRYKLPVDAPAYDAQAWCLGRCVPHVSPIEIEDIEYGDRAVYCLDVQDTHNFAAGGFIVHNCQPTNFYGGTKFLAEQMAVASNVYGYPRGTRIACTRYGNVLGSRGSVLHVWRDHVRAGRPLPITDAGASRFWMTIDQAVSLVHTALARMQGGEVFIPKLPGLTLKAMAAAVAGAEYPTVLTGLRPGGEKRHEELVSSEEVSRTQDAGDIYVILPHLMPWRSDRPVYGPSVPADFVYRSNTAAVVAPETLRAMLEAA